MGEIYKPEDITGKKKKPSDLTPLPIGIEPITLEDVIQQIKILKADVNKIKQVLRANGKNI